VLVAGAVVLTFVSAVAALTLFWQHTADVPVSQAMVPHCDPVAADPPTVALGSSGQVTFRCLTESAFTIVGASLNVTPLLQGFRPPLTSLWVFNADGALVQGPCPNRTDAVLLQNNTAVELAPSNYNYCGEYLNVGPSGIHSVSVGWTVG